MDSISRSLFIWTPNLILLGLQLNLISSQLSFQLKRIPHPWTLLGSALAYPNLDSSLLDLNVLIPLWTQTSSQFGLVSSILFLNSSGQLTQVTFTLSPYPISPDRLTRFSPEQLTRTPLEHLTWALPDCINAYPALYVHTWPNYLTRFFSQSGFYSLGLTWSYPAELPYPILLLIGLLLTWSYPATLPNFLTQPGNTSLHPTAYPTLPNHLTRPGTPKISTSGK
jgi:hypothetical protein